MRRETTLAVLASKGHFVHADRKSTFCASESHENRGRVCIFPVHDMTIAFSWQLTIRQIAQKASLGPASPKRASAATRKPASRVYDHAPSARRPPRTTVCPSPVNALCDHAAIPHHYRRKSNRPSTANRPSNSIARPSTSSYHSPRVNAQPLTPLTSMHLHAFSTDTSERDQIALAGAARIDVHEP